MRSCASTNSRDRDDEVTELEAAVGRGGYIVVTGAPWAGKTALMTGVGEHLAGLEDHDVVRFWVVDSDDRAGDFLGHVNTQMLDLLGERGGVDIDADGRVRQFEQLWARLVERGIEHQRRAVLLVDALDGQSLEEPIAPHLPISCPASASIVVSARPTPDVGDGVPDEHGLDHPDYVLRIVESPHAKVQKDDTERAINDFLDGGDELHEDIVGLLAFARGELSTDELSELTGMSPGRIGSTLRPLKRELRLLQDPEGAERYVFGHLELERYARAWHGSVGEKRYGLQLLDWADGYAAQGWPSSTPWYLVRTLDDLVRHTTWAPDQLVRLLRLVSLERADLMRSRLGHNRPLRETLEAAWRLTRESPAPHTAALVHLALVDDDIRKMSWAVPVTVVEALAVTGRASIALEIALTIDDPADRTEALRSIISAVADTNTAQALMIARLIGDDHERSSALSDIALTVARTDTEGALGIAHTIDEPVEQHRTLAEIATTVAETSVQDGLEIARSIGEPDFTISALLEIAAATDRPDVLDEATALARAIEDPWWSAIALLEIANTAHLPSLATEVVELARQVDDPADRVGVLLHVNELLERPELADEMVEVAAGVDDPVMSASLLFDIAERLGRSDLVEQALAIVREFGDLRQRAQSLIDVAIRVERAALVDEALEIARGIDDPFQQAIVLYDIVEAIAGQDAETAVAVTRLIDYESSHDEAFRQIAIAAAETNAEFALEIANDLSDEGMRSEMLCEIAEIVARTDPVRALEISEDLDAVTQSEVLDSIVTVLVLTDIEYALQIARRIPDQHSRAMALGTIASTTERPELADEALEVARGRLDDPDERAEALGAIVIAVATTMTDLAVEIARSFEEPADRVSALLEVMAQVGQLDVVDELLETARNIEEPSERVTWLLQISSQLGRPDLADETLEIARSIDDSDERSESLSEIVTSLAATATDLALEIARSIEDESMRAWALLEIASEGERSELTDEALDMVRAFDDPHERVYGLLRIIPDTVRPELVEEALENVRSIDDPESRAVLQTSIMSAIAATRVEQAFEIARSIERPTIRTRALLELVRDTVSTDTDRAREIARTIDSTLYRGFAFACIADPVDRPELADEAIEIARSIDLLDIARGEALRSLLVAAAATRADDAVEIARTIDDDDLLLAELLREIVGEIANDDPTKALEIARTIDDPYQRAWALSSIATATERGDLVQDAVEILSGIETREDQQVEAIRAVVTAIVDTRPDDALELARTIDDPYERAEALREVATGSRDGVHALLDALGWRSQRLEVGEPHAR